MFVVKSVLPQLVHLTVIVLVMPVTVVTRQFSLRDCPTVGVLEYVMVIVGSGTKKHYHSSSINAIQFSRYIMDTTHMQSFDV